MTKFKLLSLALGLGLFGVALAGCHRDVRYQPPPPVTGDNITDLKDGWVQLYAEPGFRGRSLTVKYPKVHSDLANIPADDGTANFNNEARSAKWQLPAGWQAVLFVDDNYKGDSFPLVGTGKVEANSDLGTFKGKASSLRWERKN